MSDKERKLELIQVLQADAAELAAARTKALMIHKTGDIDACGDEVEIPIRKVLGRKLPSAYYVGHGHILDASWNTSPQFDVILADNAGSPILFRAENGTEYFPFESVYAVGEAKATYRKSKKPVHVFSESLAYIRCKLRRDPTPPNYLPGGIRLGPNFRSGESRPYRNPLFSFMLFVNSGDFEIDDLREHYADRVPTELPNVLCFLDLGVVMNQRVSAVATLDSLSDVHFGKVDLYPEFTPRPKFVCADQRAEMGAWVLRTFGPDNQRESGSFGFLYYALVNHLRSCLLQPPDMLSYLGPAFADSRLSVVSTQRFQEGDIAE